MTLHYTVAELGLHRAQELRYRYARAAIAAGLSPCQKLSAADVRRLLPYCDRRWMPRPRTKPLRTLLSKRWFALMAAAVLAGIAPDHPI